MSAFPILFTKKTILGLSLSALLAGCSPIAFEPPGPSVTVMPAANKSFEVYRQDHAICKQFAAGEVVGTADQANIRTLAEGAANVVGGAALGGAVGGGIGAGIGAASGAIVGASWAANDNPWGVYGLQRRYDVAFEECMSAKGNQVRIGVNGYGYGSGMDYGNGYACSNSFGNSPSPNCGPVSFWPASMPYFPGSGG